MMILIVKDSLSADRQASDRKKSNYKQMKSSMTYPSHTGMIIVARFHVAIKKQL